jgi:predicted ATPase
MITALALTRDFKETILVWVQRDPKFRDALLKGRIETLLAGDVGTGKSILRDYIKATAGFEKLGTETSASLYATPC